MDSFNATAHMLTAGLQELPTDDVTRVKHFLAEYLGDARRPVPFGGRAQDFTRLDSWLSEDEGPSYALLAAPAGRGKSALLLRWCQRLLARSDLAVVYFPVSIRFRTNLAGVVFPALVALLARLHGENIPNDPHTSEEVWYGLLTEYITRPLPDGRRLVLVLDGVDEAADWEAGPWLFPEHPPANLRVVLSARYLANDRDAGAWLTRLGWTREGLAHTLELYPLDRTGIASVLIQMGFPLDLLGTRVDIVSELHRLSEGDPLLIRLYVDDLWERGETVTRLTPDDLHAIRPGLPGYFERWWDEQRSLWDREASRREATVLTVLNLLAGALGPLSKNDILDLAPDDSVLSQGHVEQNLEPLARFVIGDGMRQGYVFSHPRLASYFLEDRLSEAERMEVEQRFLNWGARTLAELNAGKLVPEQASPYIVQYYGAHLERAQANASTLSALVSDGWRRAWEKLDRANAGFLGDCERAWRAAARENAAAISAGQTVAYLSTEIRSLLCRVSINSMTSNISPRLMLEAVKTGIWTPAQGLASLRLIADPTPRARELVGLAPYVQEPLRTDVLQEALDTIATLKYERERLDALVELAPGFSTRLLEQILETVHAIEDEADRAGVLTDLAPALAHTPELIEKALDIAQALEDEEYLVLALEGLVPYLSEEQKQYTLKVALAIADDRYRTQALTALVPHLPTSLLPEILAEGRLLRAGIAQARLLAQLVSVLPEPEQHKTLRETLDLLSDIVDQEYRAEILVQLAPFLTAERLQRVLLEVAAIWDESYRARVLRDLLPSLSAEQLPAFLEIALAIKNEELRVSVLLQTLTHLPATFQSIILESVPAIWDEGLRVEILAQLAPVTSTDLLPRLLELVKQIKDPGYRIWLLAELEISIEDHKYSSIIAQTFHDMRDTDERIQTLLAIVERVSHEALTSIFALMEAEIFGLHGLLLKTGQQASILIKLAPRMPEAWLARTLQVIRSFGEETAQAQALTALAPRIDEYFLPEVLDIVRAMKTREMRAQVLEALVSTLPEKSKGERVREMLQVLQIIKDEGERAALSGSFARTLKSSFPAASVPGVLVAIAAMHSELHQAHILETLAPHLSTEQLEAVLYALPALRSEAERSRVLIALVPYLPERLLPHFFTAVQTLHEERWQTNTLMAMAELVSPAMLANLLKLVQDIADQNARTRILGVLAAHVSEPVFPQLWQALQHILNKSNRVWILSTLAAHVPAEYFAPFWAEIQKIEERNWQMRLITSMTAHPSESSFLQLWTVIQQTTDDFWLAASIIALAPSIPEAYYPQIFQTAWTLPATRPHLSSSPEWRQWNILETLAKNVPESFFMQFWNMVSTMDEKWYHIRRINLQQKLIMRVPESCFAVIWNAISQIETTQNQREQLYDLLITLTPERHFGQVWETVEALENQVRQGQWLLILAPKVPENFFAPFWEIVKTVKNGYLRAQILKALIPQLPRTMLDEAVEMALTIPLYEARIGVLEKLINFLSTEQCEMFLATLLPAQWANEVELSETFASQQSTWQPGHWERIMLALTPQLSEERLQAILPALLQVILKHLRSDEDRVDNLKKLLGRVPASALPATMEAIWSIQMEYDQEDMLATLLTSSSDKPRTWIRVLELATEKTRATGEIRYLLHTLKAAPVALQQATQQQLYPVLHDILHTLAQLPRREALTNLVSLELTLRALGGEEALISTVCAALEIGCWWP